MQSLMDKGYKGCERWYNRKGITVFRHSHVLVPINYELHRTFAVIVNPALIKSHGRLSKSEEVKICCIMYFDPYGYSRDLCERFAQLLRDWLYHESSLCLDDQLNHMHGITEVELPVYSPEGK